MIERFFIYMSYFGREYSGWQIQDNAVSVQEKLNESLSLLLKANIETIGAGRTDAGVHARMMVVHFNASLKLEELDYLIHKLNSILPPDISIHKIVKVKPNAHARFDAITRSYDYYLNLSKNPFYTDYSWQHYGKINIEEMNLAGRMLIGEMDYASFCKAGSDNENTICRVSQAHWTINENGVFVFKISANRFLRNMVRAIVGTLVEVGLGKISIAEFKQILVAKSRSKAKMSAPAKGLYLTNVIYPSDLFQ